MTLNIRQFTKKPMRNRKTHQCLICSKPANSEQICQNISCRKQASIKYFIKLKNLRTELTKHQETWDKLLCNAFSKFNEENCSKLETNLDLLEEKMGNIQKRMVRIDKLLRERIPQSTIYKIKMKL